MNTKANAIALLIATGIIVAVFIAVLIFFGGKSSLSTADATVNKNWVNIFSKSAEINVQLSVVTQQAKGTKIAPAHINSQFEDIYQETQTNNKLFVTANTPEKILTLIQNIDVLLRNFKEIGFTVEQYPELDSKQTYLKEYYILLDKEKELRLLIRTYQESLEEYNSLLHTFPISLSARNESDTISHFNREY